MQICTRCKIEKPLSDFYKNRNNLNGVYLQCKTCKNEQGKRWAKSNAARKNSKAKEWARNNPDRLKAASDKYRANNPQKINDNWLRQCYGINLAQYNQLLYNQGEKCAICAEKVAIDKKLFVDHDHATGEIRGLLCRNCNTGIGFLNDNVGLLLKAIKYLQKNI